METLTANKQNRQTTPKPPQTKRSPQKTNHQHQNLKLQTPQHNQMQSNQVTKPNNRKPNTITKHITSELHKYNKVNLKPQTTT